MTNRYESGNPRRAPGLERIGDLIDTVLSQVSHVEVGPVMRLRREWSNIAGDWAASSSPVRLKHGVLTVEVANGAVASKLRYAVNELMDSARSVMGETPEITAVSVRVARRPTRPE